MTWQTSNTIKTPKGDYTPKSDDLIRELKAAAVSCGFKDFIVFIDGHQVADASELHTNSIAALVDQARIEGADTPEVRIGSYQKPA